MEFNQEPRKTGKIGQDLQNSSESPTPNRLLLSILLILSRFNPLVTRHWSLIIDAWRKRTKPRVTAERWRSSFAANLWRWVIAIAKPAGAIPPRRSAHSRCGRSTM